MSRKYFGTDGIRDVAGDGLLAAAYVRAYGRAVAAWIPRAGRVLVGRDTRASGPWILDALAEALVANGHELVDGGVLPTPAVQWLCREEAFDLAIVISASHNPAADNGIKFFGPDGRKLPDDAELAIEAGIDAVLAWDPRGVAPPAGTAGRRVADPAAATRYLDALTGRRFPELDLAGLTVVLDCANGAASAIAPEALRRLGAAVIVKGDRPDGTNINSGAGVFHLDEVAVLVKKHRANLGMALDGDADRVLLVDETGTIRDGDHMLGVLATRMAEDGILERRGIVTTVMANLGLKVELKRRGISCEMVPVGDRYVAAKMAEGGWSLGGEQSGHVIFREGTCWSGDGLYTALRILATMRKTATPLSALCANVEKYPQVLINVRVSTKLPVDQIPSLRAAQEAIESELGDSGRVLLRYSGTESLLRVMVEGPKESIVRRYAEDLAAVARAALAG